MLETIPDLVNGSFEFVAGLLGILNVRRVLKDKKIVGVSLWMSGFITLWGFWNLFYYPYLGQWASFVGGILLVVTNTTWVSLGLYYNLVFQKRECVKNVPTT